MINDQNYWNEFYKANSIVHEPSSFARHVEDNYFESGKSLLELGCGNGRDAIFFAEKGKKVSALDLSSETILSLSSMSVKNAEFLIKTSPNYRILETLIMFILDSLYIRSMIKQNKSSYSNCQKYSKVADYFF